MTTATDWIIIHDGTKGDDAYALECLRCGAKQRCEPPVSIVYWARVAKAFAAEHRYCKEPNDV
jgi:hypothetical protein